MPTLHWLHHTPTVTLMFQHQIIKSNSAYGNEWTKKARQATDWPNSCLGEGSARTQFVVAAFLYSYDGSVHDKMFDDLHCNLIQRKHLVMMIRRNNKVKWFHAFFSCACPLPISPVNRVGLPQSVIVACSCVVSLRCGPLQPFTIRQTVSLLGHVTMTFDHHLNGIDTKSDDGLTHRDHSDHRL